MKNEPFSTQQNFCTSVTDGEGSKIITGLYLELQMNEEQMSLTTFHQKPPRHPKPAHKRVWRMVPHCTYPVPHCTYPHSRSHRIKTMGIWFTNKTVICMISNAVPSPQGGLGWLAPRKKSFKTPQNKIWNITCQWLFHQPVFLSVLLSIFLNLLPKLRSRDLPQFLSLSSLHNS